MILIDAYNVLHTNGVLPQHLAGVGVHGLARLISRSRYRVSGPVLVCDGKRRVDRDEESLAGVEDVRIVFCGSGETADDRIEEMLEEARRGGVARTSSVVSGDRRLVAAARRVRASTISAERFLEHLAFDDAKVERLIRTAGRVPSVDLRGTVPLSDAEVHIWATEFGLADELSLPADRSESQARAVSEQVGRSRASPASAPRIALEGVQRSDSPPALPVVSPAAWVAEAMRMWPGSLSADDLNMQKWLDHPTDKPDTKRPRR